MLAKSSRLAKAKDFEKIFKRGKSFYTKIFSIKALANESGINRYGIVISTKVSKKAVIRNKLKRRFQAALKEYDSQLKSGHDLVIIASPAAINLKYKVIKSELEKSLLTLKLFKSN